MSKTILIIAGEPSGDLHASHLVRQIKRVSPDIEFFGLGGRLMEKSGVRILYDIADLALVGLAEVLRNIFTIRDAYKKILREVDGKVRPDLAILVDYPGFNLRIAKELKRRRVPVIYYISPQVWAWGEDRLETIKETVDTMIVFFKFEEDLYKKRGVRVEFVGHPLVEIAKPVLGRDEARSKYGLDRSKKTIALLPGSRRMEVDNLLTVMLESASAIARRIPETQFIISKFAGLDEDIYKSRIEKFDLDLRLVSDDTYTIVNAADFAIVASGTATLETALIGTPMVIVYKTSLLTFIAFKFFSKLKRIGIVNIIAGKEIAPEFIQYSATAKKISEKVVELLLSPEKLRAIKTDFAAIKASLGGSMSSSSRATQIVLLRLKAAEGAPLSLPA